MQREIGGKVRRAAQAAIDDHHYVSAIDVLPGMLWLTLVSLVDWRRGPISLFGKWAASQGMTPSETIYRRWGKGPKHVPRFSKSGAPLSEKYCSTHYLSRRLQAKMTEMQDAPLNLRQTNKAAVDYRKILSSFLLSKSNTTRGIIL